MRKVAKAASVASCLVLWLAAAARAQLPLYERDLPTCIAMCQLNNDACLKRGGTKGWAKIECKQRDDICLHVCRQRWKQ